MEITKTAINFEDIPDRLFIPAVMLRDIIRVRPLTQEEKSKNERGGPDILAIPVIGSQCLMHRGDIIGNYRYTNGKKINVKGWQSSKLYVIVREANETVMVMQVPLNHTVTTNKTANDRDRSSGDYIVCLLDENGCIDRQTASIVTSAIFRKVCYIPPNEVIDRAVQLGEHNKFFDFETKSTNIFKKDLKGKVIKPVRKVVLTPEQQLKPKVKPVMQVDSKPAIKKTVIQDKQTPMFMVVQQILNEYGQRVGFVIQSKSGNTKDISKETARKLCTSRQIVNMMLIENGIGGYYFRGNGVVLDELPIKYI